MQPWRIALQYNTIEYFTGNICRTETKDRGGGRKKKDEKPPSSFPDPVIKRKKNIWSVVQSWQ